MRQLGIEASVLYLGHDGAAVTAVVGSFKKDRSPFGVMDMAGNVAEWTSSCASKKAGHCKPSDARVYMGGSFTSNLAEPPLLDHRQELPPDHYDHTIGFRCAR